MKLLADDFLQFSFVLIEKLPKLIFRSILTLHTVESIITRSFQINIH